MPKYNDGKTSQVRRKTKRVKYAFKAKQVADIKRIAKKVAEAVPEVKNFDQPLSSLQIQRAVASPIVQDISAMSQGLTENTRVGNHIQPTYVGGRYTIHGIVGSSNVQTIVRVMLIQFLENSADAGNPTWGTLLQDPSRPFDWAQSNKTGTYKVLYDARHIISNYAQNEAFNVYGEFNISRKSLKVIDYVDNNTTGQNKLYFMAVSNEATLGQTPVLNADIRMKYTDC
ncbi:MAG: coat protein [Cressdnaviricota sp.]|nr:MAG: coat protein [Cressdnaviricota sp.]